MIFTIRNDGITDFLPFFDTGNGKETFAVCTGFSGCVTADTGFIALSIQQIIFNAELDSGSFRESKAFSSKNFINGNDLHIIGSRVKISSHIFRNQLFHNFGKFECDRLPLIHDRNLTVEPVFFRITAVKLIFDKLIIFADFGVVHIQSDGIGREKSLVIIAIDRMSDVTICRSSIKMINDIRLTGGVKNITDESCIAVDRVVIDTFTQVNITGNICCAGQFNIVFICYVTVESCNDIIRIKTEIEFTLDTLDRNDRTGYPEIYGRYTGKADPGVNITGNIKGVAIDIAFRNIGIDTDV